MSRVFVARDRALDRLVAIKVFSPEVAAEVKTERFRLEIQVAAKLQHPHIVPLLFAGEAGGILYFTMPFIGGETLRAKLARDGPMPIGEAVRTLRQIASALSYAHKHGVVHRDIKPDNVLLDDEFALVADFGVAKALSASTTAGDAGLTGGGIAIGTPAYMSPEQVVADPNIDHRADIYAFGVVAYEVLTGAPPFRATTAQATLAAHAVKIPDPIEQKRPDIPAALAAIVMRCLEKKPEDRPQTASELLQLFDSIATPSPSTGASRATTIRATTPAASRRKLRWAAGALAAFALAGLGYFGVKGNAGDTAGAGLSSIAVLPLVNVGGNQSDEYFSDGMTDELANALSKLPGLRVASRTSAYAFKGEKTDVGEIGRKLKVQAVLEGTVRRSGDRLRIAAQLTNVSDGLALWSDTYERQTREVFTVQDDIARAIAEALKPQLGRKAQTFSSESRGTKNLDAFDLYLRGRYFWNRRGADNLRRAISYFDQAIAKDPNFARAHAALAIAYALLPEYTDAPPPDIQVLTRAAADRALSLDPTLAEAYSALGLSGVHAWRFDEAEAAYRKALELDPAYPTAHQWYGELLYHTGRVDSAMVYMRQAKELDPLAPINAAAFGYALILAGRYDDAITELKRGIEIAPSLGLHHAMLASAYVLKGQHSLAVPEAELSVRLDPELALREGFLAYVYGMAGEEGKARAILSKLQDRQTSKNVGPVALAVAYLGLRDLERALASLEQAADRRDISLTTFAALVIDPTFDPLRGNPRFERILRRMNLWNYAVAAQRR